MFYGTMYKGARGSPDQVAVAQPLKNQWLQTSEATSGEGESKLTGTELYRTWAHVHIRYAVARPSVVCLSVVCNFRAPYSAGRNFRQCFYVIWYLGHPLTTT